MEKLIVSPGFVKKIEDEQDTQDQAITSNSTAIAKVQNGLAFIVGNTNTTGSAIAVGQFVYVKGHSTIDEGLRTVTASISANGNITTSNTTACSDGGLNALNSNLSSQTGGVPIRKAGVISAGNSISFVISSDFSSSEGYALVSLNIVGNSLAGCALLYLGRGTGKKKDLIGSIEESTYTATYSSSGTWTITNNTSDNLYFTAIISK